VKQPAAIAGSVFFLLLAPGTVAGLVPWWVSGWRLQSPFLGFGGFRVLGITLIVAGVPVLLDSFGRFALEGLGTPAPIAPPGRLVVGGLYRFVRNPMYVGVLAVILGQALLLGNVRLLEYGATVWLVFYLFVVSYEEPALRQKFGADYDNFCANVPRWIPRLRPWRAGQR
jgi:protein-S-isoprenylcysteine O-methyltransferase Ste14